MQKPKAMEAPRYFLHGACTAGSLCHFSHDLKDKQSMACKYYLKGTCSYGKACRYDHVKPTGSEQHTRFSAPKPVTLKSNKDKQELKMVTLGKPKAGISRTIPPKNWAEAPEFIPAEGACFQPLSYSEAAMTNVEIAANDGFTVEEAAETLCPYITAELCSNESACPYIHLLKCDMCGEACMHPNDENQQKEHRRECLESHEKDMEHSFAIQRSENVTCAVCLDVVMSKPKQSERRFGILPNCIHAFCLECIRKWRKASHAEKKVVRACPICRTPSGYVVPSGVWVEEKAEKDKLIADYKSALGAKPCKYFREGKGTCPFGSSCFYKHAYPDGTIAVEKPRKFNTADGVKLAQRFSLWDFVEAEENDRMFDYLDDSDDDYDDYDSLERLEALMLWDDSDDDIFFLF
ncbi:predicted protein [Nematostella vectensis]|uniref:RING-type E3 ubiquitin transferase n=1 Tax=Nematostella vectensis TaxID=45351 RepID=A7SZF4_NEMVE|nr:predicted protein [Nematostella vectensis]|eukprot:XP_001623011.1 hypothetical protein NEMVEDRAFT_v1g248207 [Nematostella vectensis]